MRSVRNDSSHWLSLRVRIACVSIFVVSLFLPPYIPAQSYGAQEVSFESSKYFLVEDGFLLKTSSLTEQGARLAYAEGIIHTVKANESIPSIAELYGISVNTIRWANDIEEGQSIQPGQELLILPVDGVVHTVQRGQNLSKIAALYDVDVEKIIEQNQLGDNYLLSGQELIIPGGKPIVEAPPPPPVVIAQEPEPPKKTPQQVVEDRALDEKPPSVRRQIYEAPPSIGTLQKPCDCYYTQYYNGGHFATDMQRKDGNGGFGGPIFAAEAGTVIRAEKGWNGGYGNVIEIDHGNGLVTLYGHNKELHVSEGDVVTRGQYISDMGNSGLVYGPTGIHLHFEVRINGVKKNPILYLQ